MRRGTDRRRTPEGIQGGAIERRREASPRRTPWANLMGAVSAGRGTLVESLSYNDRIQRFELDHSLGARAWATGAAWGRRILRVKGVQSGTQGGE